jgi:hypothetical protein
MMAPFLIDSVIGIALLNNVYLSAESEGKGDKYFKFTEAEEEIM